MGKKRWHRETEQDREALWPLSAEERYISVDIEADGPVPGLHSMLNALSLCALHHRLFDKGAFTLGPSRQIVVTSQAR